jgi:hypothetical protein
MVGFIILHNPYNLPGVNHRVGPADLAHGVMDLNGVPVGGEGVRPRCRPSP